MSWPDSALVDRFRGDLAALWPQAMRGEAGRLGIAVSGGPDSCALLLLAHAALPGRVAAATVDHCLRPESAAEAAMVAKLCASLGVEHATLPVAVAEGNLQANARAARYAALADWMRQAEIAALATAHHADDQAETLLMRLNRASGVAGLAGARARALVPGTNLALLRPLLGWRRAELAAIVAAAGVLAADDPSNSDDRFDRARLRKALAGADWIDTAAVAASAGHLADADAAIEWAVRREWDECVTPAVSGLCYRPQAPRAIALRVLARMVGELGGDEPRGSALARLHAALVRGETASIGDLVARAERGSWTIARSPRRRTAKN